MAGFKKPSMTRLPNTNKSCEGESIKEKQRKIDDLYGPGRSKTNLSVKMDFSESLKGLKAIQREAKKATAALKELEEHKKDKYLVIEIDKLGDVPKVLHEGEEITLMEFINFQWTTRTDKPGNTDIIVDYFERASYGALERRSIREGVSS